VEEPIGVGPNIPPPSRDVSRGVNVRPSGWYESKPYTQELFGKPTVWRVDESTDRESHTYYVNLPVNNLGRPSKDHPGFWDID
jgi:hypothetical protein